MNDDDPTRLAARAQGGDEVAFGALVRRLMRPALAAAWEFVQTREDAEDIAQEAFARAWQNLGRYDPAQPFAPWFFTILRNAARNASRWDRRWQLVSMTEDMHDEWEAGSVEPDVVARPELADRMGTLMEELSPMQRACFRLSELEGFSRAEVSAMFGVSEATIRVHIHRARKALQARLGVIPGES